MKKTKTPLMVVVILLLIAVTALVSVYIGMYIGEAKCTGDIRDEDSTTEYETEKEKEPNTWFFKDTLTSKGDFNTHTIDLTDEPLGGLLSIEFLGSLVSSSHRYIHQYVLTLEDINQMPLLGQGIQSTGSKITKNSVVDGGKIYYVVVKTGGDKYTPDEPYTVKIKFVPHSAHNSADTAISVAIPGKIEDMVVSGRDVNWFKIGPLNSSGLLAVDSFIDGDLRNLKTRLLDDKTKVIQEKRGEWQGKVITITAPVDEGNSYYVVVEQTKKESVSSIPFTTDIELIPESQNSNPDNAISIGMPATVRGKIISTEDVNWYKLDLRDYSDGDMIINLAVPDEMSGSGYVTMELLEENQINVVGRASAKPKEPIAFKRGMKKRGGVFYPEKELEGGKIYYIKIYPDKLYNPSEEYVFEIDPGTMVPQSVANEEPNTYTLTTSTADTALSVNLPARIKGKIVSEDDTYWFKTNLAGYPKGGVLTVTLTMPAKTEPKCGFVCRQAVCFNPPSTPKNCYHYQFEVFESDKEFESGDKETEIMSGSVAPKDETTFRSILKEGGYYYFKISSPHGRYNTKESYVIDVRFYPDE